MNILFASSEVTPLAKTGGLGDVAAALPSELRARGHSVAVVMPAYRGLKDLLAGAKDTGLVVEVPLGKARVAARIWEGETREGVKLLLVRKDEFFDRGGLYGNEEGDYADNAARFIFFAKVVVELSAHIRPRPELLHLNDWQTALAAPWVRHRGLPLKTVFTIHNMAYQGFFAGWDYDLTNLPQNWFSADGLEFHGRLNLMKGALVYADEITTVSPSYAREIQGPEFGCGLDGVLRKRHDRLTGILNGIDTALWDPARDPHLPEKFSAGRMTGKKASRTLVLERYGIEAGPKQPVFACISRLVPQKGLDVVARLVPELVERGGVFLLLGSGQPELEAQFRALAAAHPGQVGVHIGFDEPLAHLIEAGADFFLMPSRFEPCGLNQMYSQRYGTVPIVTRTGGLADSVEDWNEQTGEGTGIVAEACTHAALQAAVERAFKLYANARALRELRKAGMKRDFSWAAAAQAYEMVYQRALGIQPAPAP
jgi:starch synthase